MNTERIPKRKKGDKKEADCCEREQLVSNQYIYLCGSKRVDPVSVLQGELRNKRN
jgi:hypothetical protein